MIRLYKATGYMRREEQARNMQTVQGERVVEVERLREE